jgi:hypothetical protein
MAIRSQADQRRTATMIDQWGRRFFTWIEKHTGDPCGRLIPLNWQSPDDQLIDWPLGCTGGEGNYYVLRTDPDNPAYIHFDTERFLRDKRALQESYEDRLTQIGVVEDGEAFDASRISRKVRLLAGRAPLPMVVYEAMAAGDPWCLGRTDMPPAPVPEWAAKVSERYAAVRGHRPRPRRAPATPVGA